MRYIGCFNSTSNNIFVCDPFSTAISCEVYQLGTLNSCKLPVKSKPGIWNVYHVLDYTGEPVGMYLQHEEIPMLRLSQQSLKSWEECGQVCVGFSHVVTAVDKRHYNDANNSYLSYHDEAVYDKESIQDWISECNFFSLKEKEELIDEIKSLNSDGDHDLLSGSVVREILGENHITALSNVWSHDCKERVMNSHMLSSTIKGGCAARSDDDFVSVFADSDMEATCIYIRTGFQTPNIADDYVKPIIYSFPKLVE